MIFVDGRTLGIVFAIRVVGLGWVSVSSSGWYVTVVAGVDVDSFSPRGTVNLWGFCSVWP